MQGERKDRYHQYYQGNFCLTIDKEWCKGCAICVKSCPVQILFLDVDTKVGMKDINRCIFCGLCELRCPDFAIFIRKKRILKVPGEDQRV